MILEIINPSDKVTLETDDPVVAGVCTLLLARGQYGLENENGETVLPILIFGGAEDWLKQNKIDDLDKYIDTHMPEMIKVLESVLYGGFDTRELFNKAISSMTPKEALKYRKEWNEKKRSSMTNIGKVYLAYADKLRGLQKAKAIEGKETA
jgi:hypothetical protein